jgi:hypothetical protein
MKTIQTFLLCLLAALLSGCLEGIENAPRGASNDVRAAPGTFAPERPPTRSAVPEPIRNAPLADDRLTLVGSGDFGPENTRSASGGLLFVRIPLDTSLPPNTPVVSMVFVRDEHGVGRWEIDRLVRSEGGRQDATPLVGYVEPNGTSSLVPVSHFSPHAAAITRAETSLVVVPLDTYYGAGHVCVPQAAFGVTTGAPVFGALGQAYRRDGFRTDVFAAAAEALVLNGQGMQVQEALIDQILSDLQREVSTANSAAELSRYSPQALRFYRSAWGAWRAALQGRGALNPNFKYTTLANTERVVSRYFAALGAVEGATRFGSAVYREIIAHGVNVGVTQARLDSLAAVLTAADLMRDPAVANGWQRTRERIEARQAEAMTRNVAALLQVVARGVADEVRLADVVGAGLSAIGGVLSRSGGALTLLAADLAQGVASEHRAQSEICALTTIAYAAATYRPAQTHLELPRQELYWAATELLALGTAKFLRGEDASITVRALQTGLLWASDTLAAANAAGIRHYADLADEARARLVALAETRLGGSAGDDVTNPGQQADPCRDRSSCSDCFANASLGCGWCAGSSTCMGATDSGPRNGSCRAGWSTTGASCGAVTPQNPGGVAPADPCLGLSTCGACHDQPRLRLVLAAGELPERERDVVQRRRLPRRELGPRRAPLPERRAPAEPLRMPLGAGPVLRPLGRRVGEQRALHHPQRPPRPRGRPALLRGDRLAPRRGLRPVPGRGPHGAGPVRGRRHARAERAVPEHPAGELDDDRRGLHRRRVGAGRAGWCGYSFPKVSGRRYTRRADPRRGRAGHRRRGPLHGRRERAVVDLVRVPAVRGRDRPGGLLVHRGG